MKRITKKLSLNRETLASLNPADLAGVNGGDIGPTGGTGGTSVTGTITSRIGCPSRLPTLCPTNPGDSVSIPTSRRACPQGQ